LSPDTVSIATVVNQIVPTCNANNIPVIPFGTGTGVAGLVNAVCGGITIDLSSMDKVLALHTEEFNCRVQAGSQCLILLLRVIEK